MPLPLPSADDGAIDRRIGVLLRTGMLISAFVISLGGAIFLIGRGTEPIHFKSFHGEPANLTSIASIVGSSAHGNALAIIQLGLLLLIATPIARVAFSIAEFAIEKDYLYVTVSAIVLAVLLFSLVSHGK
jgi:uncharacterized membrane protein